MDLAGSQLGDSKRFSNDEFEATAQGGTDGDLKLLNSRQRRDWMTRMGR